MQRAKLESGLFLSVLQDADIILWFGLLQSFTIVIAFPKTRQGTAWCPVPYQFPQQQHASKAPVPQISASYLDTCSPTYVSQIIGKFYFTYGMVRICLFKLIAPLGAFAEQSCREKNSFKLWFLKFEVALHNMQCCANPLSHAEATKVSLHKNLSLSTSMWRIRDQQSSLGKQTYFILEIKVILLWSCRQ